MTVISSLFSGISGIVANGSALSVAGDNIANMSTPAFKSSVPVFESALSQRIGEAEVGLGSRLAGTSVNFSQGAFANTTRPTDLAIQGKGFFVVENASGESFYTRAGMFEQDSDGQLVTSAGGFILQGYAIDDDGQVAGELDSINFSTVSSEPNRTGEVDFTLNLDSDETTPGTNTWNTFANCAASSNFSYSQTVYDNLGNSRTITTYYRKTSTANTWEYRTMTAASNLSNVDSGIDGDTPVAIARGTLTFDTNGRLSASTTLAAGAAGVDTSATIAEDGTSEEFELSAGSVPTAGYQVTASVARGIRWEGATPTMASDFTALADAVITHDFGDTGSSSRTTQFNTSESAIKVVTQDGRSQGEIQSIEILEDGTLRGNFSNGDSRDLFKLPIATFANEDGLNRVGQNLYSETGTSGSAQVGLAGAAGRGEIRSFSTEQSNVDLATEFVRIITFQRAFQASSRTVSTAAELLQDLVNLGR